MKDKTFYFYSIDDKVDFDTVAACVGPGWRTLLEELCRKLFHLGWDGGLLQVKEKFGTLRFYWSNNMRGLNCQIADDVVTCAVDRSEQVCEECGKYGKIRDDGGWLKCRCEECWEKK